MGVGWKGQRYSTLVCHFYAYLNLFYVCFDHATSWPIKIKGCVSNLDILGDINMH